MSHSNETPRMTELLHANERLLQELASNTHSVEEQMNILKQINAIASEMDELAFSPANWKELAKLAELQESHTRLQAELTSNTHTHEENMNIIKQMNALGNEIMCVEYPHLKNQTCPICDKKFNGWGNNPSPLNIDGKVCDDCNMSVIVPVRMGNRNLVKMVMKMIKKNNK